MCDTCFNEEINRFLSEADWLETDKELSKKLIKNQLKYIPVESYTDNDREWSGTIYECQDCSEKWVILDPDNANRGYLLRTDHN